jgi:hypothetical protein
VTLSRALVSWLVLLVVAFANGTLRVLAYPATLSDFAARQVAAGVGAVLLGVAIWLLLLRRPVRSARNSWGVGALWVALTILFEAGMVLRTGRWSDVAAQYAVWQGSLWPLLLLWILVAPTALGAVQRSGVAAGATAAVAVLAWAACGGVLAGVRALLGLGPALAVHLVAAPVIAAVATVVLWHHPRHPGSAATAVALAGTAALLDAIVVAPFLERSYAMFGSVVGTWLPLALILAASAATGAALGREARGAPAP